jgi:uncharacterized membrane protein YvbJ
MKRCPKCRVYNEDDEIKCKKCLYEFKGKVKRNKDIDKKNDESDEWRWPSDEWKDWNTM